MPERYADAVAGFTDALAANKGDALAQQSLKNAQQLLQGDSAKQTFDAKVQQANDPLAAAKAEAGIAT